VAETVLDLVLLVVMLVVLGWSVVLHAKLRRLRGEDGELDRFVVALDAASDRAHAAIDGLREAGGELQAGLARGQEAARRRGEDLERLTDSAARMLRRLEQAIADAARVTAALQQEAGGQATAAEPAASSAPRRPPGGIERGAGPVEGRGAAEAQASARAEALLQALRGGR
jgi:hypothetical protein